MLRDCLWIEKLEELLEDWEGNGLLGIAVFLSMIRLDSLNDMLHKGGLDCCKWQVNINVHGLYVSEVFFDGFWLDLSTGKEEPVGNGFLELSTAGTAWRKWLVGRAWSSTLDWR